MHSQLVNVGPTVMLREWGEGPRRVFAIHALGQVSTGALFGSAVGPLVDAGWQVTAPDLPGFGESPSVPFEDYDLTRMAELMWRLVDAGGRDPVVLVGHSVGGAIALRMHTWRPADVAALVLVDSGHLDYGEQHPELRSKPLSEWLAEAPERLVAADRDELATTLEIDADDPVMDDLMLGVREVGRRLVGRAHPRAGAAARWGLVQSRCSDDWPRLAESGTPTLLLLATEPEEAREQNEEAGARFGAAVPHAEVRLVPGSTHSMVTDLRAGLGGDLADWLASVSD